MLSGLVFCARCLEKDSQGTVDNNIGKMYSYTTNQRTMYFECSATRRGYEPCQQDRVLQSSIDKQVVQALMSLHEYLPENIAQQVDVLIRQHVEQSIITKHMQEIQKIVEHIDFSWEKGFLDENAYMRKCRQLQKEMEMIVLSNQFDILNSRNLLRDFKSSWTQLNSKTEKHHLIKGIIEQIIVKGNRVIALV